VLLKSAGNDTRGFVAKVSDFGLSMRIDPSETHVSNFYQGTLTHMVRGGGRRQGWPSGEQKKGAERRTGGGYQSTLAHMVRERQQGWPTGWNTWLFIDWSTQTSKSQSSCRKLVTLSRWWLAHLAACPTGRQCVASRQMGTVAETEGNQLFLGLSVGKQAQAPSMLRRCAVLSCRRQRR
jgi:hypothetical protein